MSTFSTISSWVKYVHHGRFMNTRFAFRNGRSVGLNPSMTRSSTWNAPVLSTMLNFPMCIGRSKYFEPCCSARLVSRGPTSTVTNVMMIAATSAMSIASARRSGCFRRVAFGPDAGALTAGGISGTGGATCSSATLFDDDEHAPGLDRRAGRHRHVLHASGLGGAQLVLHLHRLDDHDGLAPLDLVPRGDEHADDAPGHGRDHRLFAVRASSAVGGGASGAAAVDGHRDAPSAEVREDRAGRLAGSELDRHAGVRLIGKQQRDARLAGALGVDDRGDAVHGHAVARVPGALDRHGAAAAVQLDFKRHRRDSRADGGSTKTTKGQRRRGPAILCDRAVFVIVVMSRRP